MDRYCQMQAAARPSHSAEKSQRENSHNPLPGVFRDVSHHMLRNNGEYQAPQSVVKLRSLMRIRYTKPLHCATRGGIVLLFLEK